jgi:hypothetical protein
MRRMIKMISRRTPLPMYIPASFQSRADVWLRRLARKYPVSANSTRSMRAGGLEPPKAVRPNGT